MEAAVRLEDVTEQLIVSKSDGIGRITLNQPEKLNAVSFDMWQGLYTVIDDFNNDAGVRVILLEGAGGKAFCAGADISQFADKRGDPQAIAIYNAANKRAYEAIATTPKPTIARITGYCIGGGMHLALCCDLRIATDDSRFAIPAAKLGLGYGLDSLRPLVALVGPSRAKQILFTAKRFTAEEALAMGLVNAVATRDEIDTEVAGYLDTITANAPLTIKAAKLIIAEIVGDEASRDAALCQQLVDDCYASADYKEGRQAFMEKRKPNFTGQ